MAQEGQGDHTLSCITANTPSVLRKMLRIWLGDPWKEYEYIRNLGPVLLASRRDSYFNLVIIRECDSFNIVEHTRILSRIQHPNVANIHDVYSYNDTSFLIMEHLDISISQLDFQKYELEEWEIATIISEVMATFHDTMNDSLRL